MSFAIGPLMKNLLQATGFNDISFLLVGLLAGSQYSVSVRAVGEAGAGPAASALFWTEVGYPKLPKPPTIVEHRQEQIHDLVEAGGKVVSISQMCYSSHQIWLEKKRVYLKRRYGGRG